VSGREAAEPLAPLDEAEFVAVRLGDTEFGLPVERVREVLRVPPITRLPFPPPSILGVAGVRGAVLPVMDLGERLLGAAADRDGRLVVVEDPESGSEVALLVDAVPGLASAAESDASPPAEVDASLPAGWIAGVIVSRAGRLVTLLDLAAILAHPDSSGKESR
jgi:purine-binding chemotaxis protein CheW